MSKRKSEAAPEEELSDAKLRDIGLRILDEKYIPRDMARINNEMVQDQELDELLKELQGWSNTLARTILKSLQRICQDIDQSVNMTMFYKAHQDSLGPIIRDAWEKGDYSLVTRIEKLRAAKPLSGDLPIPEGLRVAKDAWTMPFVGDTDDLLWQNLQNMNNARRRGTAINHQYMNYASILQSSGSGKSRLVDQVAKRIFTIPFNLRKERGTQRGVGWPPPDRSISQLMSFRNKPPKLSVYRHYLCLFKAIFECVKAELELIPEPVNQYKDRQSLSSVWRLHLEKDKRQARNDLYAKICEQAKFIIAEMSNQEQFIETSQQQREKKERKQETLTNKIFDNAHIALKSLIAYIDKLAPSKDELTILIYFDEAHALDSEEPRFPNLNNDNVPSKYLLDVLIKSLNTFRHLSFFTIFLSTQSKLEYFAPESQDLRSTQYQHYIENIHAPITETPFDCFGDCRPVLSQLVADDLHDVVFMGLFGRPLWRSMLHEFTEEVIKKVMVPSTASKDKLKVDSESRVSDYSRSDLCLEVLNYTRSKLICQEHISNIRGDSPLTAQSAVLDVRIMLSYQASCKNAQDHIAELVTSHMRTVFSVPQGQEFLRSGYPSEPILAEAAAQQLYLWRSEEEGKVEPALQIILDHLDRGLLSRREVGEVVGRMLLMLARDRASVEENGSKTPKFSKAVPLTRFIEELFPKEHAEKILNCHPDNHINDEKQPTVTLREVFKHAVINFTHFANWADDTSTSQDAALASFIRHMAPICRNGARAADVAIPVLLRRTDPLGPEAMTMILVQFKFGASAGSCAKYKIGEGEVGLFYTNVGAGDLKPRPYITLIMELGVQPSLPSHTEMLMNPASKMEKRRRKAVEPASVQTSSGHTIGIISPVELLHIPLPPMTRTACEQERHPRYNFYAYGCSPEIYKVIKEVDRDAYRTVLQTGHLLADHPRPEARSLKAARKQKPFFSTGPPSFDWIDNEFLNKE